MHRYRRFLIVMVVFLPISPAARAANNVVSPYVDQSVVSIAWKGEVTTDRNKSIDGAWKQKLTVGYGFTDRLYLAVGGIDERGGGQSSSFDGLSLIAKYQLTQKGVYWVDSGIQLDYKKNIQGGADNVAAKLLLAKTTGVFENRANIIVQRDMGRDASKDIETSFLWSTRYLWTPAVQPGFEIQSEFGKVNQTLSFTSQSNRAGPALYGKLPGGFDYELGYLFGLDKKAPQGDAKAQIVYSFKF